MGKKSEAIAKFTELEKAFEEASEGDLDFISKIALAIENDIKKAGYEEKKKKSKTVKFLNAIKTYKNVATEIEAKIEEKKNELLIQCFNCVSRDRPGLVSKLDDIEKGLKKGEEDPDLLAFWSEFEKSSPEFIKKELPKVVKSDLDPKINSLTNEFNNFKKDLDNQNKPSRRFFGHISKFCNTNAINTLGKAPGVLQEYKAALVKELEEMAEDSSEGGA